MQLKSLKRRGDTIVESPESRFYRDVYVSAIRKGSNTAQAKEQAEIALGHYMEQFQSDYVDTV